MENKQAIEQLKSLRDFQQQYVEDTDDVVDSIYKQDVEAIDIAIKALERTALEVPVQEQLTKEKADLLLQEQFKIFAEYNQTSPSLQNINAMINIYTTLFPNQFFQE